jgi:hypothetical protein
MVTFLPWVGAVQGARPCPGLLAPVLPPAGALHGALVSGKEPLKFSFVANLFKAIPPRGVLFSLTAGKPSSPLRRRSSGDSGDSDNGRKLAPPVSLVLAQYRGDKMASVWLPVGIISILDFAACGIDALAHPAG